MVLEVADDDLVARLDESRPPALRDEVDALRRAAGEDDLVGGRGAEEGAGRLARLLEMVGRALR